MRFEQLEDRRVMAVITVTDLSDGPLEALAGDGKISLREAIEAANLDISVDGSPAGDGADVIQFDPALFADGPRTLMLAHVASGAGTTSQSALHLSAAVDIQGPGADLLTLDASGLDPTPESNDGNGARVFGISDGNTDVDFVAILSGMSLTGGDTTGSGGLRTVETTSLSQMVIFDNAGTVGGGVYAARTLTMTNVALHHNTATLWGGGLFTAGQNSTKVTLDRVMVRDNFAGGAGGGLDGTASITIINSEIINNRSNDHVGGMSVDANFGGFVEVVIENTRIADNTAKRSAGGLQFLAYLGPNTESTIRITNSVIEGNRLELPVASSGGAAAGAMLRGNAIVEGTLIAGNIVTAAGNGLGVQAAGGLWLEGRSASLSSGIVRNSTISGNQGLSAAVTTRSITATIEYTTVTGNTTASWFALGLPSATLAVKNSIIAGNLSPTGAPADVSSVSSPIVSFQHSLVGRVGPAGGSEAPIGSPDSNGNLIGGPVHGPINPLLGPLQNNGGPTWTHAPLPGSLAIDAGDPEAIAGEDGAPEFDQRGAPYGRVFGGRVDMGAVEYQPNAADFDFDGDVDGSDCLLWQRGLGRTPPVGQADGDANGDGEVDGTDLDLWRLTLGAQGGATPAPEIAEAVVADATASHPMPVARKNSPPYHVIPLADRASRDLALRPAEPAAAWRQQYGGGSQLAPALETPPIQRGMANAAPRRVDCEALFDRDLPTADGGEIPVELATIDAAFYAW